MVESKTSFKVSIVCPAYNESGNLTELLEALSERAKNFDHEIIIVDDGSLDNSVPVLKNLMGIYKNLKYISFTRNFGHQSALFAGIIASSGDCVIMLDADMQHPPKLFPEMIEQWRNGYKVVQCIREDEAANFKSFSSKLFYRIISAISKTPIIPGASDYRLIDKVIIDHLKQLKTPVFLRGFIPYMGFKTYNLNYIPSKRLSGKSKYTLSKMIKLSTDGITSQTTLPLKVSRYLGLTLSSLAFIYLIYVLFIRIYTNQTVPGWTSTMISVLLLGGVQLISVGILGEYIGKIFEKSQEKPHYFIGKKEGFE